MYCLHDSTSSQIIGHSASQYFFFIAAELKPGDGPEYLGVRSGFFFIENVFYNDMRDGNTDYSAVILEHNYQQQQQQLQAIGVTTVPTYSAKRMDDVTFSQLSLQLGTQYIYLHQGDCEHIMVVTDIRMIHGDDNQNKNAYPLLNYQSKIRRRKCRLCDIYPAR
jgi:snRNA-activating protein complex subunit 3